ncbi:MAG: NAD(P)-dependent oxidoreductase [Gemmatimonadota bacterium]|nr:NAD(P)-dependent oxidoreductase [Gemmatimonadota bacterium]MYD61746.1 NAD(P)-dependent oxidoreductase [Gemmatimonadota bacterium]
MADERFLVTGALGCIGAWTVHNLVQEGVPVTVFDLATEPLRLQLLLSDDELAQVNFVAGDIADLSAFEEALDDNDITHVIHLAGLQVPFCKADPPLGARVNVVGTANVFEAVKRRRERIDKVVYASSVAVFGAPEDYEPDAVMRDDSTLMPHTHYGVYKQANEGTAHVYWLDEGVSSIGFRPYVVYGVGRDQGITSTPTTAMLAAAANLPYHISYGGRTVFQYADDTARAFIQAARADYTGAGAFNLGGFTPDMQDVKDAIDRAAPEAADKITFEDIQLPFPQEVDGSGLEAAIGTVVHKPLVEGVAETVALFRELIVAGKIDSKTYIAERS